MKHTTELRASWVMGIIRDMDDDDLVAIPVVIRNDMIRSLHDHLTIASCDSTPCAYCAEVSVQLTRLVQASGMPFDNCAQCERVYPEHELVGGVCLDCDMNWIEDPGERILKQIFSV